MLAHQGLLRPFAPSILPLLPQCSLQKNGPSHCPIEKGTAISNPNPNFGVVCHTCIYTRVVATALSAEAYKRLAD